MQDVQDVGLQVYPAGKMEVDEGCAAGLGPVWKGISDESRFLGGHPLQDAGWNQQGMFLSSCSSNPPFQ